MCKLKPKTYFGMPSVKEYDDDDHVMMILLIGVEMRELIRAEDRRFHPSD